jgi:hypothetical protein
VVGQHHLNCVGRLREVREISGHRTVVSKLKNQHCCQDHQGSPQKDVHKKMVTELHAEMKSKPIHSRCGGG